ncbi:MAG TPA: YcaO-like family protein [Geminicoccus sp.]|jgi:ribosomal protein S12 methylthiotransferase accessory factor|uniref:YcaO-like family protein n=1 Tax=Geminicoccus sp. TaxID=2024832 RepID=UPI002E37E22E|nr:YcaO-like family protein [Geminicoccus sp.]HEX2525173.1 YcaO-like family protein [Geminicoccus sp.]
MRTYLIPAPAIQKTLPTLPDQLVQIAVDHSAAITLALLEPERTWLAWCDGGELARAPLGGSGAGLKPEDAVARCLGELAEICAFAGYDRDHAHLTLSACARDLGEDPNRLFCLSQAQRYQRQELNQFWRDYDWLPPLLPHDAPMDWVHLPCLNSDAELLLPAAFCRRRPANFDDDGIPAILDSNGCAASASLAGARAHALLELIERDATARWWYGGAPACQVDPECLGDRLVRWSKAKARRRSVIFLRLADLADVCTIVAISAEEDGTCLALGAASALDVQDASERAWLEMVRGEIAWAARHGAVLQNAAYPARHEDQRAFWWSEMAAPVIQRLKNRTYRNTNAPTNSTAAALPESMLDGLLRALSTREIWVYEQELQQIIPGLEVTRLVAPGLVHIKPRLAHPSLTSQSHGRPWNSLPLLV